MENNKRALILLHGALGSAKQFEKLKNQLSDYCIYIPELPFHGNSKSPAPNFSIQVFVEYLNSFIASKELKKPAIFGYSMGGYIALALESQKPSFSSIITLGTKLEWSPEIASKETTKLDPELIQSKVPKFADYLHSLHGSKWKDLCYKTSDLINILGNEWSLGTEHFKRIKVPVLVLRGEEDQMVTKEESSWAASNLLKGHLKILENAKHPIEAINLYQLATEINNFVSQS